MNPLLMIDGYKADHRRQYPEGTTLVYSNLTPRSSRVEGVSEVVFFGLQYFLFEYLNNRFWSDFFERSSDVTVGQYKATMDRYLGEGSVPVGHIHDLHSLGYLPLKIKAVPEGTRVPIGVPMLTIVNTHPDFFWLTNQLETILSASLWCACTSATTAYQYRKRFDAYARLTGLDPSFVKFQGHDFSFRGMSSYESACISGAAHLTSFAGTDTVPALDFINQYYYGWYDDLLVGCSVPATEHSVMSMGSVDGELETYRRLIRDVYPSGIVSIVSDTWDFWKIMTEGLASLKSDVLSREGKVVIRPDSGDPVKIVCGDPEAAVGSPEYRGAYECLWEIFGGTVTATGYKLLDQHVGLIYGDSITLDRQRQILEGLERKGFCSEIVLGIGSYTYQMVTRDTYGFAMKATYGEVNGEPREIFKAPKTDVKSEKKSARGLLRVDRDGDTLVLRQQCTKEEEAGGVLETVFEDGMIKRTQTLRDIRHRLHGDGF